MAGFTIAQIARKLYVTKIMQAAAEAVYHETILQFRSTVDFVDQILEVDGLVSPGIGWSHCSVCCIGSMASNAVLRIVPITTVQAQVAVAALAFGVVNHHAPWHGNIIGYRKGEGVVLCLVFLYGDLVMQGDCYFITPLDTDAKRACSIVWKWRGESIGPVGA